MTNHAPGSSLVQAPQSQDHSDQDQGQNHNHLHTHNHRRLHAQQQQQQQQQQEQARQKRESDDGETHIRSPTKQDLPLHERQVVIVQTVSVVHIIDDTGATISVSTLFSDPVTRLPEAPSAGVTADSSVLANPLPNVSVSALAVGDGPPSSTASSQTDPIQTPASQSVLSNLETLTSAPFTSSSSFPTLSVGVGVSNSTGRFPPSLFGNSTTGSHSLFTNSTRTSSFSTSTSASSSSKIRSSSVRLSAFTDVPTSTVSIGVGGDGSAGANVAATIAAPTATSTESIVPPPVGLAPEVRNAVVGGVMGGVAGVAILAFILMFILKWKKRQGGGILLLGDGDSSVRGRGKSSRPNGGGGLAERSVPFAVPSALASLTGQKRAIEGTGGNEPTVGEKGFYRVSGKKLISVLQSGGDGYSDPPDSDPPDSDNRDSVMTSTSYYRDSQPFAVGGLMPQRFGLGSPMRPESGVMVMRSGPGRTPVQEQASFLDVPRPMTPPRTTTTITAGADPIGRSLVSLDGSSVSRTKFTEDM
ncbi:hypothetical protein B0T22DRAFT_197644 [Podospora appendiculata]|uniref:Uncharacterized protein n=1 Tax=Podospora appendiculata TaxID=314037 RepID=A0AAE0X4A0_9PEZI|nr:hypothetical protein B0T22DRAFT_197644 [Podospora appendiculata]